jgi:diadenosine tetraphosphate (Ap4A) HIT family hydrolase
MKISLRSPEMQAKYQERRKTYHDDTCVLCGLAHDPALPAFETLKIALDEFPYDRVAQRHYMIMTKRHVQRFEDLTAQELAELLAAYDQAAGWGFESIIVNVGSERSMPGHLHWHLVEYRERAADETETTDL